MDIKFVGQPFDQYSNLLEFIEFVQRENYTRLKIAVAWAKKSGLGRVWDSLEDFKSEGGSLELILGVSEGGATEEGLRLAHELTKDQSGFVFHDPNRTFHPKVYWASSDDGRNAIFVGSSNLTAGGVAWNYEASLWVVLEPDEELPLVESVEQWFETLKANTGSLKELDNDLIADLLNSNDIQIGKESRSRRKSASKSIVEPEDNDSLNSSTISGIFAKVLGNIKSLPKISSRMLASVTQRNQVNNGDEDSTSDNSILTSLVDGRSEPNELPAESQVFRRWSKQMGASDAQRPPRTGTNPTGNLRLAVVDTSYFNHLYFRQAFFGDEPWGTADSEGKEELWVNFHVWIDGVYEGIEEIRVSHKPSRAANQGNVMTVLHWGRELINLLSRKDYTGKYVNLEKTRAGDYLLIIDRNQRGPLKP